MSNSFLIVGLHEIHVDENGQFIGVRMQDNTGQPVGLGLHPEMTHDLALGLFKALSDGTKSGKLAQQLSPMLQSALHFEASAAGVELAFDLSDGLRIASQMPWDSARHFAEQLIALCDLAEMKPSDPN
ncbi:hypothetical protein OVA07_14570 [Novosphingobium sp. SL115]|uniref:hypothetical protein n=1 Tax=Novosphingobium sp. SL115 TaxID=2995150 RepID=UPI0022762F17|nr:hypothetical protein [Novosphingobium sp. SL115]MCY1672227.1 hypothetical protein [Novosphingobium sp. SL115]